MQQEEQDNFMKQLKLAFEKEFVDTKHQDIRTLQTGKEKNEKWLTKL